MNLRLLFSVIQVQIRVISAGRLRHLRWQIVLFEWAIRSLGKKRDSSLRNVQGPDSILHNTSLANCLINSMLEKFRSVVRGVTLQWSREVPMDPKEYSAAAIS